MTLQPIVPASPRPRPARCADLTDAHRPTHQSPPVEADFGPSHDAITAEPLDLTCQFLTHASPTVRTELGQILADHGQHPVAGLGAFLDCLQLSAARHHRRDHTAAVSRCRTTWLMFPPTLAHVAVMIRTIRTPSAPPPR